MAEGKGVGARVWLLIALVVVILGVPLGFAIVKQSDRGSWTYAAVGLPVLGLVIGIALLARAESASGRGRWPSGRGRQSPDAGGSNDGEA